ncbi:MAG: NAD(+)/NADH kinase [Actinomycetota bacterium]|nr:NAD(+)/NADH kinase [Actinomycetota bacterium]
MTAPRRITLLTHTLTDDTGPGVKRLLEAAAAAGVEVLVPDGEAEKHGIGERDGVRLGARPGDDTDVAVVLGGDGTILSALRATAENGAPVFAFNYGAIGFLSTVEREDLEDGIARLLEGRFEVLGMPALAVEFDGETRIGVNDISLHRRTNSRVAEVGYSVLGDQLGRVRCDGLVAATPVGSTGYNLANGGPILAWGVEGYVVSFIAPHTLTARALVVAPDDVLRVENMSTREAVDVTTDNRPVAELPPGGEIAVRFVHDRVRLAQIEGQHFYHRIREKFGRLAY